MQQTVHLHHHSKGIHEPALVNKDLLRFFLFINFFFNCWNVKIILDIYELKNTKTISPYVLQDTLQLF